MKGIMIPPIYIKITGNNRQITRQVKDERTSFADFIHRFKVSTGHATLFYLYGAQVE